MQRKLWKRDEPFSKPERKVLDDYINRNFLVILSHADENKLFERYNLRNYKQKISLAEIKAIKNLFDEECKNINFISYNGSNEVELASILTHIKSIYNV